MFISRYNTIIWSAISLSLLVILLESCYRIKIILSLFIANPLNFFNIIENIALFPLTTTRQRFLAVLFKSFLSNAFDICQIHIFLIFVVVLFFAFLVHTGRGKAGKYKCQSAYFITFADKTKNPCLYYPHYILTLI